LEASAQDDGARPAGRSGGGARLGHGAEFGGALEGGDAVRDCRLNAWITAVDVDESPTCTPSPPGCAATTTPSWPA
jgi:hypothetical protein